MPQITAIEPQKKAGRFNIFLDGKFAFGIDEENLVREQLVVGQDLSGEQGNMLTYCSEVGKLVDTALRFLAFRPRSESEVRRRLQKKIRKHPEANTPADLIDQVIFKLRSVGYVSDAEFASWWVEQRTSFRPCGKNLLRSELFSKGVARELIEEELAKYSLEDEISWAGGLVEKRAARYKDFTAREKREKLGAYLSRRGFSWEVIQRVLVVNTVW